MNGTYTNNFEIARTRIKYGDLRVQNTFEATSLILLNLLFNINLLKI